MFGLSASAALPLLQKWITKFSTLQTQEGEKANQIWIYVYCKRTDDAYLLERRPDKGLLAGMLGWPTSEWSQNPEESPQSSLNGKLTEQKYAILLRIFILK